jgi:hypothetical protein
MEVERGREADTGLIANGSVSATSVEPGSRYHQEGGEGALL